MQIRSSDDAESVEAAPDVHLSQLAVGDETSVQWFDVAPGANVPEHSHPHEQVGFVYEGELTFLLEGDEAITVGAGGSYRLEGGEIHAAENRGGTTVRAIDVFSPPRPNPGWLE